MKVKLNVLGAGAVLVCSCSPITTYVKDVSPYAPAADGSPQLQKTTCTLMRAYQFPFSHSTYYEQEKCRKEILTLRSHPSTEDPKK